ncbi:MAG: D-2-hydroxyacid dehydrogenase [Candidatus Marinimicrobia bacterium]|nr:D-2-hydroxyacid dehydrogenase [Candidatus Neomarinimicrobiota bacterium]
MLVAVKDEFPVLTGQQARPRLDLVNLGVFERLHFGATGVDGILFPELAGSDVILTKAVGFHSKITAEHAFAMMLYFERKFAQSIKFRETRKWNQREIASQNGTLSGKSLGILGFGAVGRALSEMANVFGMNVSITSRSSNSSDSLPHVNRIYPLSELNELIAHSDYFAVCVPLTKETKGLIDRERLSFMKESAIIINVARGAIIDESALHQALSQNKIAGAGLDVFATEPLPEDSPLFELDNVFLSPHIAGNFGDYTPLAATDFGVNLQRYLSGKELRNLVDKSLGY